MKNTTINTLLVEDNPEDVYAVIRALEQYDSVTFKVINVGTLDEALSHVVEHDFDVVLLDLGLPDCSGLEGVVEFQREFPTLPVIVFSGRSDENLALEAMKYGAQDYLVKGSINTQVLVRTIRYAIERQYNHTERQKVEHALRESDERFSKAFRAVPVPVIITRLETGEFVDVNDSFLALSGYHRDGVIGKSTKALNLFKEEPNFLDVVLVDNGRVNQLEATLVTQLQNYRQITFTADIIEVDGDPCILAVLQDITERRRLEKLKDEFVSTVSHELRTPLTSISGSLGLLVNGIAGAIPDPAKNMLQIAHRNCDRLVRLINDLLDMQKIEAGKMDFHISPITLQPIIEQAIAGAHGLVQERNIKLLLTADQPDIKVNGDADRLRQVLDNLISNAIKFSPNNDVIEICGELSDERIQICVKDHGPGIPESFQNQIFQKFAQADSSDTKQKGGTGLGLSICQAIVEHHNGDIGFETVQNEGSTFWFTLPIWKEDSNPEVGLGPKEIPLMICESDADALANLTKLVEDAAFVPQPAQTNLKTLAEALQQMPAGGATSIHPRILVHEPEEEKGAKLASTFKATPNIQLTFQFIELIDKLKAPDFDVLVIDLGSPVGDRLDELRSIIEQTNANIDVIAHWGLEYDTNQSATTSTNLTEQLNSFITVASDKNLA